MSAWGAALAAGWTQEHNRAAEAEGWNLFLVDSRMWQVQKMDEENVFADDRDAWAIVLTNDLPHHRAARDIVRRNNPDEWRHWCLAIPKMKLAESILPGLMPEIIATLLTA